MLHIQWTWIHAIPHSIVSYIQFISGHMTSDKSGASKTMY